MASVRHASSAWQGRAWPSPDPTGHPWQAYRLVLSLMGVTIATTIITT